MATSLHANLGTISAAPAGSSNSLTLADAVPAGKSILVAVALTDGDYATPTVTDTAGNVYTNLLPDLFVDQGTKIKLWVFGCFGNLALSIGNTITITHGGGMTWVLGSFTSWTRLQSFDTQQSRVSYWLGPSSGPGSSPTLVTTAQRTLFSVMAAVTNPGASPFSTDLAFSGADTSTELMSEPAGGTSFGMITGYRLDKAAGSYNCIAGAFTLGDGHYAAALLAFPEGEPAGGGSGGGGGLGTVPGRAARLVTLRAELDVRDQQGQRVCGFPLREWKWGTGAPTGATPSPSYFSPQVNRVRIAAGGTETITIPNGAKYLVLIPGTAPLALMDPAETTETILAFLETSPDGEAPPLCVPVDQSVSATLVLKNRGSSADTCRLYWL